MYSYWQKWMVGVSLFVTLSLNGLAVADQTKTFKHYVTDQLHITLREGPGTSFKIKQSLKSGTPLVVLERNDEGWSKVRLQHTTGWVVSRFLTTEPVAEIRLSALQSKQQTQQLMLTKLQKEHALLKAKADTDAKTLVSLRADNFVLNKDLKYYRDLSASEQTLLQEKQALQSQLATTQQELNLLQVEVASLKSNNNRDWMLIGGLMVAFSILLGRYLRPPRLKSGRSSYTL